MKPAPDIAALPGNAFDLGDGGGTVSARPFARALGASHWWDLYELTKPRMNFLVVVTTMVGYYMAARGWADWTRVVHTLVGTAMTAAGASILNQYVERDLDARMPRTADRPLPAGRIAPLEALCFGVAAGAVGVLYLSAFVNVLTAILGVVTLASYVFVYTPLKRVTSLCTLIGAVPGAIPPLMGWAAATGRLAPESWALFAILFLWQMPHFLAIAILYKEDYAAGGFKMLPVVDEGLASTSRQIVVYGMALIPVSLSPTLLGIAGPGYFLAAIILGLVFLAFGIYCAVSRERIDARRLFFISIIYLPLLLAAMMTDKVQG